MAVNPGAPVSTAAIATATSDATGCRRPRRWRGSGRPARRSTDSRSRERGLMTGDDVGDDALAWAGSRSVRPDGVRTPIQPGTNPPAHPISPAGALPVDLLDTMARRTTASFAEREEIAILNAQDVGVREIARRIQRDPGTISRKLRRNAATRGGRHRVLPPPHHHAPPEPKSVTTSGARTLDHTHSPARPSWGSARSRPLPSRPRSTCTVWGSSSFAAATFIRGRQRDRSPTSQAPVIESPYLEEPGFSILLRLDAILFLTT